ncbi:MAG TPA: HK97 family phage prohead protease [Chitinophagales bacterium]|nr:HK97 family phage prohead protease [Chitinophagales bacterium]
MQHNLTFILSDETVNSYGFRVLTQGIALEQFKKNPVMLYNHDETKVIGKWDNIRVEGTELKADAVFDEQDEFAMSIKAKVEQGFIKGASLGFNISDSSEEEEVMLSGQTRPTVTGAVAFEASIVAMPGNLNALYDATGKKLQMDEDALVRLKLLPVTQKQTTDMKLSTKTLHRLNLKPDSTLVDVEAAVERLAKKADDTERELNTMKEQQKVELKTRAAALVDAAIKARKITAADKEEYVTLAATNYTAVEKMFAKMNAPLLPGGNTSAPVEGDTTFKLKKEYEGLNLRELEKRDSKTVLRMKREAPELYAQMFEAQYQKRP